MSTRYADVTITLRFRVPFDDTDHALDHPWPRCGCGLMWDSHAAGACGVAGAELIDPDVDWVEIDGSLCASPCTNGDGGIECGCKDDDCELGKLGEDE